MNHTYSHHPLLAAAVDAMSTIERCSKAAHSMARQRAHLRNARLSLKAINNNMARYYLALWNEERAIWAHLVRRTIKQEQQQ